MNGGVNMKPLFDFDNVEDNCVTLRNRDTMEQVRLPISELKTYIEKKIEF